MTIQRYTYFGAGEDIEKDGDGELVKYDDHLAALAEAQKTNSLEIEGFKKRIAELEGKILNMEEGCGKRIKHDAKRIAELERQLAAKDDLKHLTV